MLRYRLLGHTGLRVSEFALGTMRFDDPVETERIIATFAEAGGNFLDTASAYGESEAILGQVLRERDRFVLGTKYTLSRDVTDPNAAGNHRKNLVLSLEQSLRRLRTDYVDVYWVHVWDQHTPIEETMRALDDVVRAGKALAIGISDAPAWVVARANTIAQNHDRTPFAAIQVPYSLLERGIERELLPMAEAFGLTVTAWSPLAGGALAAGSGRATTPRALAAAAAVAEVAAGLGVPPEQVALAWTRHRSRAVLPILGVRTADQLSGNLAAAALRLPEDVVRVLEDAVPFDRGFPADFVAECDAGPMVYGDAVDRLDVDDSGPRMR
ncbi:aldo/keto reductase [Nocardia sp. NPDC058497]|uniref:aldo/keto reductase n=1 Tax=Nocardia sp. NPDC058497 TaxID=3346529 RepID=UPI00364955F9